MSALFTDPHRKCVKCGERSGVWPIGDDDKARCPICDAVQPPQKTVRL